MNIKKYISRFNLLTQRGRLGGGLLSHSFSLIRADKLFSTIYIAGTAVAIASAMVVVIVLNIMMADISPEVNRSRTLYLNCGYEKEYGGGPFYYGFSKEFIDSCLRKMECVEAATGFLPSFNNHYDIRTQEEFEKQEWPEDKRSYIMGCDQGFFQIYKYKLLSGRFITEKEFRANEQVAVITDKMAKKLGDDKVFYIYDRRFKVVGIVESTSMLMRDSYADIFIPCNTEGIRLSSYYGENEKAVTNTPINYNGRLTALALLRKGYTREDFINELEPIRLRYNKIANAANDEEQWYVSVYKHYFKVLNFFTDEQNTSMQVLTMTPFAIIILIFLFLPAINLSGLVTNRMEARLPEMGIRKAFGAKKRTLLREVINENLVLTLCGGVAGWLLAWLFVNMVSSSQAFTSICKTSHIATDDMGMEFTMFFTPTLFLICFLCCAVLNLMAALLPAWRSLRKPIVVSLNQKR
jgi:putative ABC transport system permease protein